MTKLYQKYFDDTKWEDSVVFPKNRKWFDSWALLSVIADHTLSHLDGNLIELGIGASTLYFTELAKRYKRISYHCDTSGPKIKMTQDVPQYYNDNSVIYQGTTDKFFEECTIKLPIAFAFIDARHEYDFVKRDFYNIYDRLIDNGIIAMHDTHPPTERHTRLGSCGTAYKFRQELEDENKLDVFTFPWKVQNNAGLTFVRKIPENLPFFQRRGIQDEAD